MTPIFENTPPFERTSKLTYGEEVTVLRRKPFTAPGGVQRLGGWDTAEAHKVPGVWLDRVSSGTMPSGTREESPGAAAAFGPLNADIRKGDRIRFPSGPVVDVDGTPYRTINPFTGWQDRLGFRVVVDDG